MKVGTIIFSFLDPPMNLQMGSEQGSALVYIHSDQLLAGSYVFSHKYMAE